MGGFEGDTQKKETRKGGAEFTALVTAAALRQSRRYTAK